MRKQEQLLFIFFALAFICSTFVKPYPLSWIVKIIPLGILIISCYQQVSRKYQRLFLLGLIFSTSGDIILDFDSPKGFIFGLGSFLIAHVLYILSMCPIKIKLNLAVVGYVIYGLLMLYIIGPVLGNLFIPVLIYMSVLMSMGIFTLLTKKSNLWLIIGGVSFIVSDSLLGINKFHTPIPFSHPMIMLTYYLAQFALVKGMFEAYEKMYLNKAPLYPKVSNSAVVSRRLSE